MSSKAALTVLDSGARVMLAGDIEATVHAATIRDGGVFAYQVVWWDGRVRYEEYVYAREVTPVTQDQPKIRVGFA